MEYYTNEEADDREMLLKELTMSKERLVKTYKVILKLLEGQPVRSGGIVLANDVLLYQRAASEAETELYNILDIVERLYWTPVPPSEEQS